jgi:hypothetical protein
LYNYTLKLNPSVEQQRELEKRFRMATDIYRKTLFEIFKRVRNQKKDPLYKKAYKLPKGKERNELLKTLDTKHGLTGWQTFYKFANNYRNSRQFDLHIPSTAACKLGRRAWDAYSKVKFGAGASKRVNVPKMIDSFEGGKGDGLRIREGQLVFSKKTHRMRIPIQFRNTEYESWVLRDNLKFIRLLRREENFRVQYYIQLIVDGTPPNTHYRSSATGTVGIDIGTSTVAIVSDQKATLQELAPTIDRQADKLTRLQRKLDRQRRANNPNNYNEDGTVKAGTKHWVESKRQRKTRETIANIQRKQAMTRKLSHNAQTNEVLQQGDTFIVEKMNFKGLQARAKETTVSETTGRFKRKKRFGKSIAHRAPASWVSTLSYKAAYAGKTFIEADTYALKASQYDHTTGEYTKHSLSTRVKQVGDATVQRDLYSAFLLSCVNDAGNEIVQEDATRKFPRFLQHQKDAMNQLESNLQSTGVKHWK